MKNLEIKNLEPLTQQDLVVFDGGVIDPTIGSSDNGDYGINSPGGCIPNPFDKIFKPKGTILTF